MKNIIKILGVFVLAACAFSCNEDDPVEYSSGLFQEITDPFLQVRTGVVSFQAGTPSYNLGFNVVNGTKALSQVTVYSQFEDAATGDVSDEVVFGTYAVSGALTAVDQEITYDDLKNGIVINGGAMPDDQTALAIGSLWRMRFEGTTASGDIPLTGSMIVGVLSRFAGLYRVLESSYFRIGADNGGWNGTDIFIGSVDATTYSHNDNWGPFGWAGNSFTFSIDETDNSITVPLIDGDGQLANGNPLFSGNRAVGCHSEPEFFVNVPCAGSNVLIPDDVGGKHRLILTYGYFTDGSGPREFYEVMEKIVN